MYATVSTWRLHESVRSPDAYETFLREMIDSNIDLAREVGMIDAMMIRTGADTMIGVAVYETREEAEAAGPIARGRVGDKYADRLELISRVAGPARDMPDLSGR